jgi:glycosyltransferase involved in cell wall biosynthesis
VIVTFLVSSAKRPVGGALAVFEFANGLRRRGHRVHIVHLPGFPDRVEHVGDIDWFDFEPGVENLVWERFDEKNLPDADLVEITPLRFFGDAIETQELSALAEAKAGLPFLFVQAYGIVPTDVDHRAFRTRCPKVCIARWLVDAVVGAGAPREQAAYVPYGLDHVVFRVTRPIAGRPPRVAMLYHAHPIKAAPVGLAAIAEAQRRVPGLEAVVFASKDPIHAMPAGVEFVKLPSRELLVDDIYNGSQVFVCSSAREGFGLCGIEAMAGGCALVSTANGGAADYAVDDDTALVVEPGDAAGLADRIERLVRDDDLRVRIATRGVEFVRRFDWDDSARQLEMFLDRYRADPARMRSLPRS